MIRIFFASILILNGCSENTDFGSKPFIEMESDSIVHKEQVELCKNKPESIFCKTSIPIGDIRPARSYAIKVLKEMNSNFSYNESDSTWHYNDTVYEYLRGDCEDIASTMAKHMIEDGVDTKYLHLAFRKIREDEYHVFLAVDTSDAGMLHLDYANSGYPIEPRINFHMRMDDSGVDKWVKGNISEITTTD